LRRVETAAVFRHQNLSEKSEQKRTLTVRIEEALPGDRGVVTSRPGGIDCPTTCRAGYEAGTEVKLRGGGAFGVWTSECHGTGDCILVLDRDTTVSARAEGQTKPVPEGLGVSVSVSGRGTVTSRGIRCGGVTGTLFDCQALYHRGSTIVLRALEAQGSQFRGWGGFCSGKKRRCTLTVAASMTVTAAFFTPRGG